MRLRRSVHALRLGCLVTLALGCERATSLGSDCPDGVCTLESTYAEDACTIITSQTRATLFDYEKFGRFVPDDICLPRKARRVDHSVDVRVVFVPPTSDWHVHDFLNPADPGIRDMFGIAYTDRQLTEVEQLAVTKSGAYGATVAEGDGFYFDDFSKTAIEHCPESHARVAFTPDACGTSWARVAAYAFTTTRPASEGDGGLAPECAAASGAAPVGTACVLQRPMFYDPTETILAMGSEACGGGICIARHLSGDTDPDCEDGCVDAKALEQRAHCTCRCDAPEGSTDLCKCPEDFSCVPVVASEDPDIAGSYCVRDPVTDMPKDDGVATVRIQTSNGDVMIDATEVTQARYAVFFDCDSNESCAYHLDSRCMPSDLAPDTSGQRPVTCVAWDSAKAYCEWTGKRLCTLDELQPACTLPAEGISIGPTKQWTADCTEAGCRTLGADPTSGCSTSEGPPDDPRSMGFRCCSDVPTAEGRTP